MGEARINRADRRQVGLEVVDLETLVPDDHRVRAVWSFVQGLDLAPLQAAIKARGEVAGRPATDPMILLALWLHATADGIGSAGALARACEHPTIHRWICGGVGVSHAPLSEFRVGRAEALDRLMAQSLTALIGEGLLSLDEVATDGTKVRAGASKASMRREVSLLEIEARMAERIASLKQDLEGDGAAGERRSASRRLAAARGQAARGQAARGQAARVAAALAALAARQAERARWAAKRPGAAAKTPKAELRVSTTDPQARMMRMADEAMRACCNIQVATARGFIVAIRPTKRCNDHDLAGRMVSEVERVCGRAPDRLLADAGAMTRADIIGLAQTHPALTVHAPPVVPKPGATPESQDRRARNLAREPACLQQWRARMAAPEAEAVHARRCLTEHAHAKIKNRGFGRMLVRGLDRVRAVCLLHAVTHNMLHALMRRAALAAA